MVARIQESIAIDGHGPEAPRHAVYIRFDLFHPKKLCSTLIVSHLTLPSLTAQATRSRQHGNGLPTSSEIRRAACGRRTAPKIQTDGGRKAATCSSTDKGDTNTARHGTARPTTAQHRPPLQSMCSCCVRRRSSSEWGVSGRRGWSRGRWIGLFLRRFRRSGCCGAGAKW